METLSIVGSRLSWSLYLDRHAIVFFSDPSLPSAVLSYDGDLYPWTSPALMAMRAGGVWRLLDAMGPLTMNVVFVSPSLLADGLGAGGGEGPLRFFRSGLLDGIDLIELGGRFVSLFESQRPDASGRQRQALRRLLLRIGEEVPETPPKRRSQTPPELLRARDYLVDHYAEALPVARLAEVAHLSRHHFGRRFREAFGLPPHQYQLKVRLSRGQSLLRAGVPLREIDVGFSDQSALGRHFKRTYGVTPYTYQMSVLNGLWLGGNPL